jgi:hypothetical protein
VQDRTAAAASSQVVYVAADEVSRIFTRSIAAGEAPVLSAAHSKYEVDRDEADLSSLYAPNNSAFIYAHRCNFTTVRMSVCVADSYHDARLLKY